MMEIKFRAWDTSLRIMLPQSELRLTSFGGTENYGSVGLNDLLNKSDWKLMQFTGRKDKNGKEIYEGDLLKSGETKYIIEVAFKDGSFFCKRVTTESCLRHYRLDKVEIIGNIYQNPELLSNG